MKSSRVGSDCGVKSNMRTLGLFQRIAPARVAAATRRMHTQVATTQTFQRVQEVSFAESAIQAVDPYLDRPVNYRELPVNYAPETRFTVDSVASADAQRFKLHPSVGFWANHTTQFKQLINSRRLGSVSSEETTNRERLADLGATVTDLLSTSALQDAESAAYWAYHLGRAGFFLGASAGGAIAHHLSEQLSSLGNRKDASRTPWQNLSANATSELTSRLAEGIAMWKQDLENIKNGLYKLPWDMTTLNHRQYNPLFVLSRSAQFFSEAIYTLNRRVSNADPNNWFSTNMYPKYYADNTFHYQTDGWFSLRSANVYEFSTEALFFGRQDAMQRTTLLPLTEHIRAAGADPAGMTLLEVSCGTGRFHTFIKDNYPTMSTIASDLSPFYLTKARDNVKYWKSKRAARRDLGGTDNTGTDYIQCAMESVPLPDASVDIVVCMYAFHEMPEDARLAAAKEFYRLLKPGGLAVLTDSAQLGDRPAWDKTLGAFGNFNEPHYRNYIACDFGSMFESVGFQCGTKYVASASKSLSFTKPRTPTNNGNVAINGNGNGVARATANGNGNGNGNGFARATANGNGRSDLKIASGSGGSGGKRLVAEGPQLN